MPKIFKQDNIWFYPTLFVLVVVLGFLSTLSSSFLLLGGIIGLLLAYFIFKKPFLGIIFIAFFLPFERLGAYEAAGGTIRLSQFFTAVTLLAWFWQMVANKKINFRKFPTLLPLILFLVVNLIGLLNAENLGRSIFVLLITLFTMILAFLTVNLISDKEKLQKVTTILLISAALVSLFGLYQFVGDMLGLPYQLTGLRFLYTKDILGFTRIQSTALEPLYFANYLLIPLSIIYAFFLSRFYQSKKWLLVLLMLLLGINLFLTISRGGYLGLLASALIITFFYFRSFFTWKKITVLAIIFLILYFVGVQFLQIGNGVLNWENFVLHVSNVFSGPSFSERMDTFEKAYQAFLQHPLVGIGPGSFGPYASTFINVMPQSGWPIVNNEFLELLTETGILGLLLFIIILAILFLKSVKAIKLAKDSYLKALMIGLLGAFIGVIVQYQTFSILYIMHIWFLFGLMIACQNIIMNNND